MGISKRTERLELSKEIEDFYDQIVSEIKELIAAEKYTKAEARINEELEQPYCPGVYEDEFQQLKSIVVEKLYNIKLEEKFWSKQPRELIKMVYCAADNQKLEYWNTFLTKVEESDEYKLEDYVNDIQLVLGDDHIGMNLKKEIFCDLYELEFNHIFSIFNNNLFENFKANPFYFHLHSSTERFHSTGKYLYIGSQKDINLQNICFEILYEIREYYFPIFPDCDTKILANTIISYAKNVFQGDSKEPFPDNPEVEYVINAVKDRMDWEF